MILVHQLMSPPLCLPATVTLEGAARFLLDRGVHGAPVLDREGRVLGVVSLSDLLLATQTGAGDAQVSSRMSAPALSVDPGATLYEAARTMVQENVHRLLVLDREGRPIGVVTPMDILAGLVNLEEGFRVRVPIRTVEERP